MKRSALRTLQPACLGLIMLAAPGCGGQNEQPRPATDHIDDQPLASVEEATELRLVSFSPALSRMAVDLGFEEEIVGRTPWCEFLDPSVPVVGDLQNIDFEVLVRLQPTHVLVQPPATGIDPELLRLVEQEGWVLGQWSLDSVDDVIAAVRGFTDDLELRGTLAQASRMRAQAVATGLEELLSPASSAGWRGTVLVVLPSDPVLAFGDGTYLDDLIRGMGVENATQLRGWVKLTLEDVTRLDPDAIIIVRSDPASPLGPLPTLSIKAVRNERVAVLTDPEAQLPSTGLLDVAGELRRIFDHFAENAQ